jgi:hypothetical protein
MRFRVLAAAVSCLACTQVATAQQIAVQNHDFESPALAENQFTTDSATGWSFVSGSGPWGVFHPTQSAWQYTAPSGNQILYSNGPAVQQVTAHDALAGQSYLLVVDVVNRPFFGSPDYFIELWAGNTLLAEDVASVTPPPGGSEAAMLFATVAAGSPAIGQPLTIRLGGESQVNFDDVRLVPEPGALGLLAGAAMVSALAGRRHRRFRAR